MISAFAQQHGDPTGTRSSALNVFIPDALKTGRLDLRPDSYVHELAVDSTGKAKAKPKSQSKTRKRARKTGRR